MHDVIEEGTRLWEQITSQGILSLDLSDWIWIVGAVCLLILALKCARKIWKFLLFLAAVILILVLVF